MSNFVTFLMFTCCVFLCYTSDGFEPKNNLQIKNDNLGYEVYINITTNLLKNKKEGCSSCCRSPSRRRYSSRSCGRRQSCRPSYQFLLNAWRQNRNRMMQNQDCERLYQRGQRMNGMYMINVRGSPVRVYCEFQLAGRNWVVIQRRVNANLTFYNTWAEYQAGFGDVYGNFWLGLNAIHLLTNTLRRPVLRIDFTDFMGNTAYAEYSTFRVESETRKYRLRAGGYSGNAGDSLSYHNGAQFTTRDNDNDCNHFNLNCANVHMGGWWYRDCMTSNLNGIYRNTGMMRDGIVWYFWRQNFQPLQTVSMKIRACS